MITPRALLTTIGTTAIAFAITIGVAANYPSDSASRSTATREGGAETRDSALVLAPRFQFSGAALTERLGTSKPVLPYSLLTSAKSRATSSHECIA